MKSPFVPLRCILGSHNPTFLYFHTQSPSSGLLSKSVFKTAVSESEVAMYFQSLLAVFFTVLATANPITCGRSAGSAITIDQILAISPKSSNCDNPPAVGECATAEQAAPAINYSFDKYQVTSAAEQAALISLMAFESIDFKYNHNHFPGVVGQGTRNMQYPNYNDKYAASIPELSDRYVSVTGNASAVLDLLLTDQNYDFGSAAWFLTTQCTDSVRQELQKGTEAGWEEYITSCVGTTVTNERKMYWNEAIAALGVNA